MIIVPESTIGSLITRQDSFTAVEKVFASMAKKTAYNFPVIREAIGHADALYGFKSGFDRAGLNLGLKSGGYWPSNVDKGLTNHQSTIFLFDADTGKVNAVVGGNLLTALRTASAAAVSVAHLARTDSKTLGIIGAGHQASFQLEAVIEQRDFERVVAWNRSPEKLATLEETATKHGLEFSSASLEELGEQSDVIVTITSSFDAILQNTHVKAGTHIACMGTDTKGKQEIESSILKRATLFTDEIAQSVTIGECQHAIAEGSITEEHIVELGSAINKDHTGRSSDDEITVFDGTGVGLQDLAVASTVVDLALEKGVAVVVDF